MRSTIYSLIVILSFMSFFSCMSPKKFIYFKDIPDSIYASPYVIQMSEYVDPKIQPNDLLSVSIQTLDPATVSMNNVVQGGGNGVALLTGSATSGSMVTGFVVDKNGYIDLPLVGQVQVSGLSLTEAKAVIARKASQYYKEPSVNIRFLNFTITLLGDIGARQYSFPTEKVSILDAIAQGGDLAFTGKRDNILLVRDEDGVKKCVRLNINSADIFKSPYFYLHQRDLIYIEPNKGKVLTSSDVVFQRNIGIVTLLFSTLSIVLTTVYILRQ
jgi:polysaccharide export outer membrane protein